MSTSEGQHRWDGLERKHEIEVVWICMEKRLWLFWEKDAEDGVARKEEMWKT